MDFHRTLVQESGGTVKKISMMRDFLADLNQKYIFLNDLNQFKSDVKLSKGVFRHKKSLFQGFRLIENKELRWITNMGFRNKKSKELLMLNHKQVIAMLTKDQENPLRIIMHLLEYASQHENYVILEGILNATWYRPVFQFAKELFGGAIFAYYYDLSFEETLKRHQTRGQSQEFGAEKMARWWKDSDISDVLDEKIFRAEISLQQAINLILLDIKTHGK